jgi:hypothetical protein
MDQFGPGRERPGNGRRRQSSGRTGSGGFCRPCAAGAQSDLEFVQDAEDGDRGSRGGRELTFGRLERVGPGQTGQSRGFDGDRVVQFNPGGVIRGPQIRAVRTVTPFRIRCRGRFRAVDNDCLEFFAPTARAPCGGRRSRGVFPDGRDGGVVPGPDELTPAHPRRDEQRQADETGENGTHPGSSERYQLQPFYINPARQPSTATPRSPAVMSRCGNRGVRGFGARPDRPGHQRAENALRGARATKKRLTGEGVVPESLGNELQGT